MPGSKSLLQVIESRENGKPADEEITVVLLCQCGSNISNNLDMDAIRAWIRKSGKVQLTIRGNLLCSPKEKKILSSLLKGDNPYIRNRKIRSIVVAGCSPRQHENTFREIAENNGINLAKVQMANIREQCAWVTKDKSEATAKAIRLIAAALDRSLLAEELDRPTIPMQTGVVIIGGGIAGIQAALALSRAGRKVFIVEKEISLGGSVIKTEEVAPNMECAPCLLAPLLAKVRDDPGIEVITNARVREVVGFYGNFTVTVEQKARYIESSCIGCEECYAVCPVAVDHPFHHYLGKRKAVYGLFAGAVPAAAAIDREHCLYFEDQSCSACKRACAFQAVNFEQVDKCLKIEAGAVIVATGFANSTPATLAALGYKKIDGVYTTFEIERFLSTNGPTGGQLLLPGGQPPASVAVIHCAGSLQEGGLAYCSGICCLNALKTGDMLRSRCPGITVYNIHNDLVLSRPGEYAFFEKQRKDGTHFEKYSNLSSLRVVKPESGGKIRITGSGVRPLEVDMVVLSTGLMPAEGSADLARLLNVETDGYGYFKPDHALLHNTGTVLDGIYAAGCAAAPADIASSVNQAGAVAGDILSKIIPGRELELEIFTAHIREDKCAGCKLCISVCPFKAISYDVERKVSVVNEVICRGCGTCAAACPGNALQARHYTSAELAAEIGGLLDG